MIEMGDLIWVLIPAVIILFVVISIRRMPDPEEYEHHHSGALEDDGESQQIPADPPEQPTVFEPAADIVEEKADRAESFPKIRSTPRLPGPGKLDDQILSSAEIKELLKHPDALDHLRLQPDYRQAVLSYDWSAISYTAPGLAKLDIRCAKLRGASHYPSYQRTKFTIGRRFTLLREPDNEYDPNAIAITNRGSIIGYMNKGNAKAIAPRMDAGEKWICVNLWDTQGKQLPMLLYTTPEVYKQLNPGA